MIVTLGFGGGCHWCTEAIFQALRGVLSVEQGWISSFAPDNAFSEAVLVHFNPTAITPLELLEVHLHTHASRSAHSMQVNYRSSVYTYDDRQHQEMTSTLERISTDSTPPIVTRILRFREFRKSRAEITNYYLSGRDRPFSRTHILPKIDSLRDRFPHLVTTSPES